MTVISGAAAPPQTPSAPAQSPALPEKYYQDPLGLERYVVQEKVLFEWRAPSKLERRRSPAQQTQLMLIAVFCVVVTVLLAELLVALTFAVLAGLIFILLNSKPLYLDCSITTLGVKVGDKYYFWGDVSQFWFENRAESRVMYLRLIFPQVQKVRLIIRQPDEEMIKQIMANYLLYKKPQLTTAEKMWQSVSRQLPIDLELLQL